MNRLFTAFLATLLVCFTLVGCGTSEEIASPEITSGAEDSTFYEEGDRDQSIYDGVAIVNADGDPIDAVDVSISDEEFKAIADANDLWDVPLDENGDPDLSGAAPPPLSSTCSIASTVTGVTATWGSSGYSGSCYNYFTFSGDYEADCYIKYNAFGARTGYHWVDGNACASAALVYYGIRLAAYYDSSSNAYLRVDRRWCEYSNCEDGLGINR